MRLALTFVGIQCFLHIVSVSSTLSGKNKSPKQFTLSCSGMDYSIRKQRKAQNENENSSESFKGLYPEGQEVLYTYSAVVTTGTKSPAHFVSQFNLTGNIKVQGFKNKARVQFLNLKYTIYSGDFLAEKKLKTAKLPEIAATLYEPFDIFYKDGQVEKLDMTPGTLPWSKSIIQALSGILQLHLPKIHTEKFTSFISSEQSIHGNCAVLYSVKPMKNKLHVTKFYSTDDCQRESTQWSNVEDAPGCSNDEPLDEKLESYSLKTYRVTPYGDDTLLIREVFSEGKTYKYLGKNTNSSHYISVSQKLQLVSMNDITRVSEISNPEEVRTLEYDARQFSSFKFSTNEDVKNVVKKIFQLFPAVRHELDGPNSLTSVEVNPQEPHLIPLLITYLRKLDFHMLKQIYNELEKMNNTSSMDRFTKLLPLVGGKDSALFLVKLVKNNKIRNFDAELLISSLPFHTRQLSAEHLTEFEDLLYLPENISSNIRNAAVLSFATLVYRTCKYDVCSAEITNKYTLHYIENSNEFLKQLVYLAGLSNLRLENIADFFEPIISGEEPVSGECIRVFGLRAVFPVIAANPEKAYEVYWPIFVNRENSLELRATALVLLLEAQQESSIFMQLYQIMTSDELNSHLYNIYYKLIKSYSEDNKIRNSARTHIARQIVKSMKKPAIAQFPSSHYTFSFADGEIKILAVFNPKIEEGISLYISYSAKYTDSSTTSYSAYIKIIGIDGDFLNNLLFKIYDSSALEEVLKKVIKSKLIHENIRIEIILFSQQQVVSLRSYDRSNIEDFLEDLISLLQIDEIAKFSWFYATSFFNKEIFFVTDLGFPGVLSLDSPILSSFRSQPIAVNTTQATEVYKSFDLRYWSQASIVLKVKNTMVDIWQGVIRSHTSHFNFPLTFKINFENQRSLLLRPAKENNHTGFKWHSQTDIFTVTNNENYDALTVSCKVCASTSSVKHKIAQNVQSKVRNKGYSLFSKIFDCEDDESLNLLKFIPNFSSPNLINTLGTIFSAGVTLEKHLLGLPISGSCGFSTAYTQSKEYVVCFNPTIRRNNFTLLVGGSESSKECVTDDTIISLTIEGSSEDYDKKELKGECKRKLSAGFEEKLKEQFKRKGRSCGVATSNGFEENQEWCEKEMKPQIMSCIQAEMNERGQENVLKLDVKVKQLPKDLEEAVSLLLNDHQKDQSDSGQRKEEDKTKHDTNATLIINFAKSKYSLDLYLPSAHIKLLDKSLS